MKVTLKNNTFDIYSSCPATPKLTFNRFGNNYYYTCNKTYTIELHSKYHIFENYNGKNEDWRDEFEYRGKDEPVVKISTNLYTIIPRVDNPNKSDLFLHIDEDDLKKILQSKEAKITLPITMFSKKLLDKEMIHSFGSNAAFHQYNELEPTILLDISNISFNELKSQCDANFKECKIKAKKMEKERNKPLNRLKRFFNRHF